MFPEEEIVTAFNDIKTTFFPNIKEWKLVIFHESVDGTILKKGGFCDTKNKQIFVPPDCDSWELDYILVHEFCHVAEDSGHETAFCNRMDAIVNQLVKTVGRKGLITELHKHINKYRE